MLCRLIGLLTLAQPLSLLAADTWTWSPSDVALIRTLSITNLKQPGPSPSNKFADKPAAARLGERLFFDTSLSPAKIACSTCHNPRYYYTDRLKRARGASLQGRNTPTIVGAAYQRWFYWDGRRDSLWAQALVPFEAPDEMGSSRVFVVQAIALDAEYRRNYEAAFGRLPGFLSSTALPPRASPVLDEASVKAWGALPALVRQGINTVFANLGKAIAAFERTLLPTRAAFDDYADAVVAGSDPAPVMSAAAIRGLRLFIDPKGGRCVNCHNGPLFTNGFFHDIGSGVLTGPSADFGRSVGLRSAQLDPFNCLGKFSDADPNECTALRFMSNEGHGDLKGAFKVPSLRNVEATSPYFHDGSLKDLDAVLRHYDRGGNRPSEIQALGLGARGREDLVAFLRTLAAMR